MSAADFALRIKICGVTTPEDAALAVAAGATAIGLNFFPRSKRFVSAEQASAIVASLPATVMPVGVFVDADAAAILATCSTVGLRGVQLHGAETPADVAAARRTLAPSGLLLIKALATQNQSAQDVLAYLDACAQLGGLPGVVLLDAATGASAGHGAPGDWSTSRRIAAGLQRTVSEEPHGAPAPRVVLAGGLAPANVAQAIAAVHPAGVDVASGVESAPGRKDAALLAAFVAAAEGAFRA